MTSCLLYSLNIFGARKNNGQTWTHKIHHGLDLGEASTFHFIVYYSLCLAMGPSPKCHFV
jgi:hypothetical protein